MTCLPASSRRLDRRRFVDLRRAEVGEEERHNYDNQGRGNRKAEGEAVRQDEAQSKGQRDACTRRNRHGGSDLGPGVALHHVLPCEHGRPHDRTAGAVSQAGRQDEGGNRSRGEEAGLRGNDQAEAGGRGHTQPQTVRQAPAGIEREAIGCSETSRLSMSRPGCWFSTRSMRSGWPTRGGAASLNLRPTGAAAPAELTALTRSASAFAAAGAGWRRAVRPAGVRRRIGAAPAAHREREREQRHHPGSQPHAPHAAGNLARTATAQNSGPSPAHSTRALLVEIVDVLFPEARFAKPRKGARKRRIGPALGHPGRVVQHARRAQHLDQPQLAMVDGREALVARQQFLPLSPRARRDCRPGTSTGPGSPAHSGNRRGPRTPGLAPTTVCCRGGSRRAAGSGGIGQGPPP